MPIITNTYNSNNESKNDLFAKIESIKAELVGAQNNAEGFEWFGVSATAVKAAWDELTSNFNTFANKVGEMFGENITMQNTRMEDAESDVTSNANSADVHIG